MQVVYINVYGKVVTEPIDAAYKVTLNGSYRYSSQFKEYYHEIASIEPSLPLTELVYPTLLVTP